MKKFIRLLTPTKRLLKSGSTLLTFLIIGQLVPLIHASGLTEEGRKLFGGYRITPKQCRAGKTLGDEELKTKGTTICMFNHECAQRGGEVVGACMDGFLFGACCHVATELDAESTLINDAQNAYYHHYQQQKLQEHEKDTNKLAAQTYGMLSTENTAQTEKDYTSASGSMLQNLIHTPPGNHKQNDKNHNTSNMQALELNEPTNDYQYGEGVKEPTKDYQHGEEVKEPMKDYQHEAEVKDKVTSHANNNVLTASSQKPLKLQIHASSFKPSFSEKVSPNDNFVLHTLIPHRIASTTEIATEITENNSYTGLPSLITYKPLKVQTQHVQDHMKDQYVLIHTISNNEDIKNPVSNNYTTASAVTAHVDSIETIIQQLNHSNHGPAYNVLTENDSNYIPIRKNTTSEKIPPYTKPHLTCISSKYNSCQEKVSETSTSSYVPLSSNKPSAIKDSHIPLKNPASGNNYIHISSSNNPLSSFSKLPAVGVAYPVNMSDIDDLINEESYTVMQSSTLVHAYPTSNTERPTNPYHKQPLFPNAVLVSSSTTNVQEYSKHPESTSRKPTIIYSSTTEKPAKSTTAKPPASSNTFNLLSSTTEFIPLTEKTQPPKLIENFISSTTRQPPITVKPPKKHLNNSISTSYVTGPTSPRPTTHVEYHYSNVPPLIVTDDKLDSFVLSTAQTLASVTPTEQMAPSSPNYMIPPIISSAAPIQSHKQEPQYNGQKKPGFVKVQSTVRPLAPTVLITPKPTAINTPPSNFGQLSNYIGTSGIHNSLGSTKPVLAGNSKPTVSSTVTVTDNVSNFDDAGYFGAFDYDQPIRPAITQPITESGVPSDDKPAFPGYYGPTPTYPTFQVPSEKIESPIEEEETYTSPNDFVNFPPVRNPNLNMSATSSAVTNDFDLSTPTFIEDHLLKTKMNTLVHKIVESLQGNFEDLAELIEQNNDTVPIHSAEYTANVVATTHKSTRKPTTKATTYKPRVTTKKSVTRLSTKAPVKKPTSSRKPVSTTKKPVVRRTTTTTRKPGTRKPTKKLTTTTTAAPVEDDLIDEEDGEDTNPSENEIADVDDTPLGSGGRKFQCGMRPQIKTGRIVGGKGSTFGAYPWQVLVRESTWLGLFTKNKCGGVLITNRFVITAAHCQPGFLASLVAVMGEFDISGDLESKRAITKNVKRVIVHRQYDPATFENDIALLELDNAVQYDSHIVPICMPSDKADFTGRMATVTGWGRLKYGGGVPSVLQEVQVPIIENSVCQEMFHTAGHNKRILNSFLCAGYANGQKDSCEGDSGGPLVLQRPDGRYELAGTVSHGIKCAAPYLPGVYMRTTFYKPWLRSITGVK
uniref:Peptidase S1 domain-containing protein n=1 Tax=Glossina pallidipes TaxID=7398 RepID=A0A1A9ZGU9_GLOPL